MPFSLQVLKEAGLESAHREGLISFMGTEVLTVASKLQTADSTEPSKPIMNSKQICYGVHFWEA